MNNIPEYLQAANDEFININGVPHLIKVEFIPFRDVPAATKYFLQSKLDIDYNAQIALEIMGIEGENAQLERFTHCKLGGFDRKPDIDHDSASMNVEYFDCFYRKDCPAKAQKLMCSCFPGRNGTTLHPAELEVMKLIAQGKSEKEIAAIRDKSVSTIHSQTASIRKKIEAVSVQDIVRFAINNNII